jgi:hypothetical protein
MREDGQTSQSCPPFIERFVQSVISLLGLDPREENPVFGTSEMSQRPLLPLYGVTECAIQGPRRFDDPSTAETKS